MTKKNVKGLLGNLRRVDCVEAEVVLNNGVYLVFRLDPKKSPELRNLKFIVEGHTDGSMKGQVPKSMVQELSLNRANAVKEAIVRKFASLQPNQFSAAGMGWDRPFDPADPDNAAKNRRVEIKVYPAEATSAPK